MGFSSDLPPHGSARPMPHPAPVDDPAPTTAMLKGDIDAGRTGDKTEVFDPGLSPLGTDDEAAGTPASHERVKQARTQEGRWRWLRGARAASAAHGADDGGVVYGFAGLIAALGIVMLCGIAWLA